eukprot:TRINITY_DN2440_c0_g1_i1.p1 TRINITY_DN2440_c0_g1~~TRINITY_DN2440_c0_g1_i1.p1  ORF type:complete len:149 (-),score=31.01 TRINITY_DN2440_c0_g1_i1:36-482(-)
MKAEVCSFSGLVIHPGHGMRIVDRDGRVYNFRTAKEKRYFLQKQKAAKFCWTQVYRKLHKKGMAKRTTRRRGRRVQKVQKSIYGMDLNTAKRRRAAPTRRTNAEKATALKTVKARRQNTKGKGKGRIQYSKLTQLNSKNFSTKGRGAY